jgi:hypothetical protein
VNDAPPPPPPPASAVPPLSNAGRTALIVLLLVVAVPVLGFTACGLFVGFSDLIEGSSGLAGIGFACAIAGGLVLWGLVYALRRLRKPRS